VGSPSYQSSNVIKIINEKNLQQSNSDSKKKEKRKSWLAGTQTHKRQ